MIIRDIELSTLSPFDGNARVGKVDVIADSLRVNGQYRPIVVNIGSQTGRPNEVLAGNHTVDAARLLGWETISAVHVDVDDQAARRIVLADNRTSDLGGYDEDILADLLGAGDLSGTGFAEVDLDALTEPGGAIETGDEPSEFRTLSISVTADEKATIEAAMRDALERGGKPDGNRNAAAIVRVCEVVLGA